MINAADIKQDFPIFSHHPDLVYLDTTATSLKPAPVIRAMTDYYERYSANVFRGLYSLSETATEKFEEARGKVARFVNAQISEEIIFVRNTSEAINLVAYSLGRQRVGRESEVLVSIAEHHSNFVPWQQLALENGAAFKVVNTDERGIVPLDDPRTAASLITKNTVMVGLFYASNVLGTVNPLKKIIQNIRKINPKTLVVVDAAQAVPSLKVDVQDLDCDFLAFSGHKMLGPTGVGVLWGRKELLADMFPFQYGGEMVREVSVEKTLYKDAPHKFEAGTPHIAGVIGLGEAVDYLSRFGEGEIQNHEQKLLQLAMEGLRRHRNFRLIGPPGTGDKVGILSFHHARLHPHDISQVLSDENIAVRAGNHCAMPLHRALKIPASTRASFYIYNTEEDVEKLLRGIEKVEKTFI